MNLFKLSEVCKSGESAIHWCQGVGLVPNDMLCKKCTRRQQIDVFMNQAGGYFRCAKRHEPIKLSILHNTWFSGSHLSTEKILILTYCFTRRWTYDDTILEMKIDHNTASRNTIADWFSFCREICMIDLDVHYENVGKIGGPGKTVEIDETKVGKRKYHRGRMVEGNWIFGMVERESDNFRLELCPENKRDRQTLYPLIHKHILPGTTIISDAWGAYFTLDEEGFIHQTVNHSVGFVDQVTGAHTNTIESNWRPLKNRIERGGVGGKAHMAEHLCEYLWHKLHKNDPDKFMSFVNAIKLSY